MKTQITRNYNISDNDLIERAIVVLAHLLEDLDAFTNFDSSIDADKVQQLTQLIEQIESYLSDNVIIDRQAQLTAEVNKLMQESKDHYNLLSHFIKKAFKESPSIRNEFGENDYANSRNSQVKMIQFMQELFEIAKKYQQELIDAGAKQEYIDKTGQLYTQLNEANKNQELYKDKRPVITEERINVNNELWDELVEISSAAKFIFKDEPAKMKMYLMPRRSVKHKDDTQHIEAGDTIITIDEGIEQDTYLKIENTGNTDLIFFTAAFIPEQNDRPENLLNLAPEVSTIVLCSDISHETFGKLIVHNTGTEEGSFKVQIME